MALGSTSPISHVFILIHGTFAKGAAWTREDSKLCRALGNAFGSSRAIPFEWSGANTHSARLRAAGDLRRFIRSTVNQHPAAKVHLIAHSHGGNVSLYALRERSLCALVASLVCIATPFIVCTPTDTGKLLFRLGMALSATLITGSMFMAYYLGGRVGLGGQLGLVVNLLLAWAIPFAIKRYQPAIDSALYASQSAIVRRLKLRPPLLLTLVVRVALDEAASWLRLSYVLTRVPNIANQVAIWILLATAISLGVYAFSHGPGISIEWIYLTWFKVAIVAMATFGLIILIALILRSHPFFFGWEGLFDSLLVNMNMARTPGFSVSEHDIKLPNHYWARHSALYANDEFLRLLVDWVRSVDELNASGWRDTP